MSSTASHKCLCCNDIIHPDARNLRHQQYCEKDACRKASKAAGQVRWLAKPENQDYFCGPANSERVRQWRLANPGYSRHKTTARPIALQDDIAATIRQYINRGRDILRMEPRSPPFNSREKQTTPVSGTPTNRAPPIQLDRPTPRA